MMEPQRNKPKGVWADLRFFWRMARYWARVVLFPLFLFIIAFLALPALAIGLLLWWIAQGVRDRSEYWRGMIATGLFCAAVYVVWIVLNNPLPFLWGSLRFDLAQHLWYQAEYAAFFLWLFNLWFTPLVALLLAGLSPTRPAVTMASVVPGKLQHSVALASSRAIPQTERPVETGAVVVATRMYTLGRFQGGEWVAPVQQDGLFAIPPEFFDVHGLVIGEPKAGKTTTLIKLAAIARMYGRKVIFLDLKGSRRTAALFYAAMRALGQKEIRLYPAEAYDGWRGDAQSLYNRLMQQIDPVSHPFYRSGVGSTAVSLACKAPGGPPRTSYDFLRRLDNDWLEAYYASDGQALREIAGLAGYLNGVALTFSGFFRGLAGGLDGTWAYEDADACYIGVNGIAHREEAATLGRYLLDDAAHFATERKEASEQALLIIDEFGILESTNATALYEQIRESGLCIYAAGQSYQALGRERDNLLAASAVKIVHRCGSPEPIIKYAGKREIYKFSRSLGNEAQTEPGDLYHPYANTPDATGGVMRPQDEYTIPIETVQQLSQGHVVLIQGGQEAYVKVAALTIPAAALQSATDSIAQAGHYKPLTPPPPPPKDDKKSDRRKNSKKESTRGQAPGVTPAKATEPVAQAVPQPEPLQPPSPAPAPAPSTSPDKSEKPPVPEAKEGDDPVDFFE